MKKQIALLVVFMLMFLFSAGCIDIYLVKDFLVPHEEDKIDYVYREYTVAQHNFTSRLPDEPIVRVDKQYEVPIIPGTDHIRFDIRVEMTSIEDVWGPISELLPDNSTIKEFVDQIIEQANQRYVEVTISSPDGEEWFNHKFNNTDDMEFPAEGQPLRQPEEGEWIIVVEGAGSGGTILDFEYHDSYTIDVSIKEPKIS